MVGQNDSYEFKWFEEDCMPQTVLDVIKTGSPTENNPNVECIYLLIMFFSHTSSHIVNHF